MAKPSSPIRIRRAIRYTVGMMEGHPPTRKTSKRKKTTDHTVEGTLAAAEALCQHNDVKLTAGRRLILEILARSKKPLGAYDMIEKVAKATGKRPAPISIYRALDFLLENGLIHRLASCNAYLACDRRHSREEPVVFLICEGCGTVVEATSASLCQDLAKLAGSLRFVPYRQVMEIAGRCTSCKVA